MAFLGCLRDYAVDWPLIALNKDSTTRANIPVFERIYVYMSSQELA